LKWIHLPQGDSYLMSVLNDDKIQWYVLEED